MIAQNNITNIRYSRANPWKGQVGMYNGFCKFVDIPYCLRATFMILMKYRKRGADTYISYLSAWCPPSENDTPRYVHNICMDLDVLPFDVPVTLEDFARLISVMAKYETGYKCSSEYVLSVLNKFNLIIK